jgi:hypothetical protein
VDDLAGEEVRFFEMQKMSSGRNFDVPVLG